MEPGCLRLRELLPLAEHLARSGEVKPALRNNIFECGEHMMRPVDVRLQRGKFVVKRIADETLRRQVVAFLGLYPLQNLIYTGEALEGPGVQLHIVDNMADPVEAVSGGFPRPTGYQPADPVS